MSRLDTMDGEQTPLLGYVGGERQLQPPERPTSMTPDPTTAPLLRVHSGTDTAGEAPTHVSCGTTSISPSLHADICCRRNLEHLAVFRQAVGIAVDEDPRSGLGGVTGTRRNLARAYGMYRDVVARQRKRRWQGAILSAVMYALYLSETIISAVLTALGPVAGEHTTSITVLGATNTVVAGVLALVEGRGLPDKLHSEELEFRGLRGWIEETESLLAIGAIGKNDAEVKHLIETAFKKYNRMGAGA